MPDSENFYCTQYRAITTLYIYIYIYIYLYTYPQTRVSSCPRLISVAQVNEYRTTDVSRVLKAPGVELAKTLVAKKQVFCSHQCIYKFKYVTFELVRSHFR